MPRVELGRNSYPNLVSCCLECNSKKGHSPAADFLSWLYRKRRLTAVASGKLPPPLATTANPLLRKGRPPLHPADPQRTILFYLEAGGVLQPHRTRRQSERRRTRYVGYW